MQLQSILTCPKCSRQAVETMPTDACQFFYDCKGCGERLIMPRGRLLRVLLLRVGAVPADTDQHALLRAGRSLNPDTTGKAMADELARLGKPHVLKIYPPVGRTADDGHNFVYTAVAEWETDVFGFLDQYVQR